MAHNRTPEAIEAEASFLRLQLRTSGAAVAARVQPSRLVDSVKSAVASKTNDLGSQLGHGARPASLLLFGGALGTLVTLAARQRHRRDPFVPPLFAEAVEEALNVSEKPSLVTELKAAVLSALGVGLGYVAGSIVPRSGVEDELIGPVREVIQRETTRFIDTHAEGMKQSAFNLFGLSRIAAATLAGLAIVAEQTQARRS